MPVAPMSQAKCAVGAECLQGKLLVCGKEKKPEIVAGVYKGQAICHPLVGLSLLGHLERVTLYQVIINFKSSVLNFLCKLF